MKRVQIMVCIIVSVKIVVFAIFGTSAVSFRLALSVEHEPEIVGSTAPATASTRQWQVEFFPFRENTVLFSALWQLRHYC